MEGQKFDKGKPATHLLPPKALLCVAEVLGYGAVKYGEHNWRAVPDARKRYVAATLRHLLTDMTNEQPLDPESGLPHIAHAIASLLFILEIDIDNIETMNEFLEAIAPEPPSSDEL